MRVQPASAARRDGGNCLRLRGAITETRRCPDRRRIGPARKESTDTCVFVPFLGRNHPRTQAPLNLRCSKWKTSTASRCSSNQTLASAATNAAGFGGGKAGASRGQPDGG